MENFFGLEVASKDVKASIPPRSSLHISQVALPGNANGKATLYVTVDGKSFALGTVDAAASIYQIQLDHVMNSDQKVTFVAKGNTSVHVTGYVQPDMDDGMDDMMSDEDDMDLEDQAEMDMPVVAKKQPPQAAAAKKSPKQAPAAPAAPAAVSSSAQRRSA